METKEIKHSKHSKIRFPLKLYLQQLFAANLYVKFINPVSFWRRYQINHLEACREFDTIKYLKNCHQAKLPLLKSDEEISFRNQHNSEIEQNIGLENASSNKILISQPSLELKYRGVTYHKPKIVAISASKVDIKPDFLTLKTSQHIAISNNYNSKISSNFS